MAWLTAAEAREEPYWPKCDVFEDDALTLLLTSAREQCEDWAPVLSDPDDPPERYRLAQAMQARALWRAQRSNASASGEYPFVARHSKAKSERNGQYSESFTCMAVTTFFPL